jgi:hypothetical protein
LVEVTGVAVMPLSEVLDKEEVSLTSLQTEGVDA